MNVQANNQGFDAAKNMDIEFSLSQNNSKTTLNPSHLM